LSPCRTLTGISGKARSSLGASSSTTSRRGETHRTCPPCSKTRWTAGRTASVFPDPATAHTRNRFSPDRTASRQRSATHFCPAVRAGRRKSTRTRQASLFSSGKKKKRGVQARERPRKRHRSQLTHWLPHRPHRERNNPSGPVPHRLQRQ